MAQPQIYPIMGTMTIGIDGQIKPEAAIELVKAFVESDQTKVPAFGNRSMIDTARVYQVASGEGGDTESTLSKVIDAISARDKVHMATKAINWVPPHFSLSRESVLEQHATSMKHLGMDSVDLYYLHMADAKTDIGETLKGIKELHEQGKFKEFGLSNFPAWMVADIWYRCKAMNMVLPTVYQGMYNIITRTLEPELVAVCRELKIKLFVYNPLAGGLLSGRYKTMEDMQTATEGRFAAEHDSDFSTKVKAVMKMRYSKEGIFDGIAAIAKSIEEVNASNPGGQALTMVDVALRWLLHHSYLSRGDGIIIGFSKVQQLEANLAAWQGGPLPEAIVEACDLAWQMAKPVAESYFRGLGPTPGSIETFLEMKAKAKADQNEGK
mmetsp:Transcript_71274/g.149013  ORF Transcript_71274/g.149013 Transcript_71274/m.149013 type:complete len:381 (-) Transcript_71274:53-1195(-)|eukprot:CAMPEP_0206477488 /NCGR_PEP_ID=MMETSP0324_2-20121206/35406_1 /ASSEMBLY_ACC=CAM_ASM_000836 /TAXON_ID=2866 /ORGANISM="Crypthecodinium cohnii, Strain Seligo" /LENGTH=380 /DNA_ID=CAMNT_0053953449 /DNA_START=106 /DNA_END=1248 /DNA_ORIENTATION=-